MSYFSLSPICNATLTGLLPTGNASMSFIWVACFHHTQKFWYTLFFRHPFWGSNWTLFVSSLFLFFFFFLAFFVIYLFIYLGSDFFFPSVLFFSFSFLEGWGVCLCWGCRWRRSFFCGWSGLLFAWSETFVEMNFFFFFVQVASGFFTLQTEPWTAETVIQVSSLLCDC